MNVQKEFPLSLVVDEIILPSEIQSFLNENPFLFDFLEKAKEEIPKFFGMEIKTKLFLHHDDEDPECHYLVFCFLSKKPAKEVLESFDRFLDFWIPFVEAKSPKTLDLLKIWDIF
jgi:hypothetical protein